MQALTGSARAGYFSMAVALMLSGAITLTLRTQGARLKVHHA
jgi:MFS-type transporter involved in bile tolerance (Atg22 family)